MTCEDCIHFTEEHNTQYADLERFHKCNASKAPFWVEGNCDVCELFKPKEDSWESVSK